MGERRPPSRRGTRVYVWDFSIYDKAALDIPSTEYEALMEAPPFEEPHESMDEKLPKLEALRDALENDVLSAREVWIIEAIFWRGLSIRALAAELGLSRTYTHRLKHKALAKLRGALSDSHGQTPTS